MDTIIVNLHKQILKSFPKDDRDRFERIFKDMIALQSSSELLKGLTNHKKLVVLRDALAEFDLQKQQNDSSHIPVYNSVTKATFTSLLSMCKLKSSVKAEVTTSAPKKSTTDGADVPSPVAHIEAKLREVSVTQSKPMKVKRTKKVTLPSGTGVDKVYNDLFTYLATDRPPYNHVPYIECKHTQCAFTRTLFQNIALTKCEGHKKCVPSGWFPHVGLTLWKSLASKHTEDTIFKAKARQLKPNEMQPLVLHKLQTALQSSMTMEEGYDSDASTLTMGSSSSSGYKRRRSDSPARSPLPRSYTSNIDWSQDVDREYPLDDGTSTDQSFTRSPVRA